jgi:hypothetical protein
MQLHQIDPLQDPRWTEFLSRNPQASLFHSPGWLDALHRTYGYKPLVFTTSASHEPLTNGIPFCHVNSWLTGSRLVSVPFSDHCQPLVSDARELDSLLALLKELTTEQIYKYVELRPLHSDSDRLESTSDFRESASYHFHAIDLRPNLDELFSRFHKSCVQRKIRRAESEKLIYEEGRSEAFIKAFYSLMVMMRRRHGLIPQPLAWFRNLSECLGDGYKVRLVRKGKRPIASIITINRGKTLVYKYGCSDARFHSLGGMALLFWKAVQDGKMLGAKQMDLGRSDNSDEGLILFKQRLGANSEILRYYRFPGLPISAEVLRINGLRRVCARLPSSLSKAAGNFLYKHVG